MNTCTCPNCSGKNLTFKRETVSANRKSKGNRLYLGKYSTSNRNSSTNFNHTTIAICNTCGYTWETTEKKTNIIWKIIFFPIFLSIWLIKTDKIKFNKYIRYGIVALMWTGILVCGITNNTVEVDASESIQTEIAFEEAKPSSQIESTESIIEQEETVSKSSPQVETNLKEETIISNEITYKYIGNKTNGKLHDAHCRKLPEEENRVYFETKEDAINAGYTDLCGICLD